MERTNTGCPAGARARRAAYRAPAAALLALLLAVPAAAQPRRAPVPGGWLGVGVDTRLVDAAGALRERIVITRVEPQSPAARAGLRAGDEVIEVDGRPAVSAAFRALPFTLVAGDTVELVVRREDRNRRVVVVAGQRPGRYMLSMPVPIDTLSRAAIELMDSARAAAVAAVRIRAAWADSLGRQPHELRALIAGLDAGRIAAWDSMLGLQLPMTDLGGRLRVVRPIRPDSIAAFWFQGHERGDSAQGEFWRLAGEMVVRAPDVQFIHVIGERGVAGAEFVELNPGLARYFDGATDGLLAVRVAPATPASRARLEPGDVIVSVEGRPVRSVDELRAAVLRAAAGSKPHEVRLAVIRKGEHVELRLRSEQE